MDRHGRYFPRGYARRGGVRMIYWNVSNRCRDRYTVWMNGNVIADNVTFDHCYNLVMEMVKLRSNVM